MNTHDCTQPVSRDAVSRAINDRISESLQGFGVRCASIWDSLAPVVRGRMAPRAAVKYVLQGVCPGFSGRFKYFGTQVYFPRASAIFRITCECGVYERAVTEWLRRLVEPGTLLIDVGANIGLMSVPVLRAVERSRVLSFEPSPNSLPYLQRTWRESEFRDRWAIIPSAAGEAAGTVHFCLAAPRYGAWDGFVDTKQAGRVQHVEVAQTTVDTEWRRVGRPRVSCIKIDVEGAETKVLIGAEEVIACERPHILLEWSRVNLAPHGTNVGVLLEYVGSHAYDLFALPSLSAVTEIHVLELHMRQTEMFLLVPRRIGSKRPRLEPAEVAAP